MVTNCKRNEKRLGITLVDAGFTTEEMLTKLADYYDEEVGMYNALDRL